MVELGGFLSGLSEADARALVELGRRSRYAQGSYLMREGERSEHVAVLQRGRVKIVKLAEDGRELLLGVKASGDLLGEVSAIDGGPRSADVVALEPVEAVLVPTPAFEAYLAEHQQVALAMLRMVLQRLRSSERRRVEFGRDISSRVARQLLELTADHGEPAGDGTRITVPLSHDELAAMVGTSRETVSRALSALRADGIVATRRRSIHVVDLAGLRRRAAVA